MKPLHLLPRREYLRMVSSQAHVPQTFIIKEKNEQNKGLVKRR